MFTSHKKCNCNHENVLPEFSLKTKLWVKYQLRKPGGWKCRNCGQSIKENKVKMIYIYWCKLKIKAEINNNWVYINNRQWFITTLSLNIMVAGSEK